MEKEIIELFCIPRPLTEEERKRAYELWFQLTGALTSLTTPQRRLLNITQRIQNYFKKIRYEDGIRMTESALLKHEGARVVDFDSIRYYLHQFWKHKDTTLAMQNKLRRELENVSR